MIIMNKKKVNLKNIFNFLPQDFTYKIDELIKSQRDAHEGFETSGVWLNSDS